jgi:hypothetical protein
MGMVLDAMRALATCQRFMDTATMRKRGSVETPSRGVCVTNIRTLRSGVPGNGHAPFWSSGRRSDPPIDCNHHPDGSRQVFLRGLTPIRRRYLEFCMFAEGRRGPRFAIERAEIGNSRPTVVRTCALLDRSVCLEAVSATLS